MRTWETKKLKEVHLSIIIVFGLLLNKRLGLKVLISIKETYS